MSEEIIEVRISGGENQPWRDVDLGNKEEAEAWRQAGLIGVCTTETEAFRYVEALNRYQEKHLVEPGDGGFRVEMTSIFKGAREGVHFADVEVGIMPTGSLPDVTLGDLKNLTAEVVAEKRGS